MSGASLNRALPFADSLAEHLFSFFIEANVTFATSCKLLKILDERVNRGHRPKEAGRVAGTKPQLRAPGVADGQFKFGRRPRFVRCANSFVNKVLSEWAL